MHAESVRVGSTNASYFPAVVRASFPSLSEPSLSELVGVAPPARLPSSNRLSRASRCSPNPRNRQISEVFICKAVGLDWL